MTTSIQSPFSHEKASNNHFEIVRDDDKNIIAIIHHGFYKNDDDSPKTPQYTVVLEVRTEIGDSTQLDVCSLESDSYNECINYLIEEVGKVQS